MSIATFSASLPSRPSTDGTQKSLLLEPQRLAVIARQRDVVHRFSQRGGTVSILSETEKLAATSGKIQMQKPGTLEEPQPALTLQGNPACRDVGHRTALEYQPGVRDVNGSGEDRDADRIQHRDGTANQAEHEIDVMDHQVQHYGDVRPAELVGSNPERLHEPGAIQEVSTRSEHRVETLHVPDRQREPPVLGQPDQLIGLFQCGGEWLLHQCVTAVLQDLARRGIVVASRDGHHQGLADFKERIQGRVVNGAVLSGHGLPS
jgi:hypothetical protein